MTIAHSQSAGNNASSTTVTVSFGSDVSADSLIIICGSKAYSGAQADFVAGDCSKSSGTATIDTVTLDRQYYQDVGGGGDGNVGIWSCLVTGGGSLTMQITGGGLSTNIHVAEFTGSWDSSRDEGDNASGSATNNQNTHQTGTVTSGGDALFIGVLGIISAAGVTITKGTDFTTITSEQDVGAGGYLDSNGEYRIVSGSTTDEADWTSSGNNSGWYSALNVYKEVAAVTVSPGTGSVAISTQAPSTRIDFVINVPTGTLTLTGYAPEVQLDIVIPVPPGVISFTSYVPTVQVTDNHVRAPPTGQLTITGNTPELQTSYTIDVPTGQLSLAGFVPSAEFSWVVSPDPAGLTLTGLVPSTQETKAVSPATGSLALVGYAPQIDFSWTIDVPAGALSIVGYAPNLGGAQTVSPGTGSLTITGEKPSLQKVISGAASSLFFTGYVPTVTTTDDITIEVPTGSLTITGYQPSLGGADVVSPGTGQLTLSGLAPEISFSWTVDVPAGSMVITGYAPTVIQGVDVVVNVPTGSIVCTGYAPSIPGVARRKGRRGRKRLYVVTIDGQDFVVSNMAQAEVLLAQVREIAEEQVESEEPIKPVKISVKTAAGKESRATSVLSAVRTTKQAVQRSIEKQQKVIQKRKSVDLEIAELLEKKLKEEEEAIIKLLLL